MARLEDQLVMPGGSTAAPLSDLLIRTATDVLREGDAPPAPMPHGEVQILSVRELDETEARVIAERTLNPRMRVPVAQPEGVKVRHHAIARLLAMGRTKSQVCEIMGMGASTLSTLERSPAFQALLLEYMNMMDREGVESYTRLKIVGNLGMDELTRRLAEMPQQIKTGEVLEIVKLSADRTGLGPTSKQVTLNGRLSPADLRAIKAAPAVIEAEYSAEDNESGDRAAPAVGFAAGAEQCAEGGISVREDASEVADEADAGTGLVSDLGSIFR